MRSAGPSGSIVSSSAKMHANDQMSMAVVYRWSRMSSGARYQRVTTCVVICRVTLGQAPAMLPEEGWRESAVPLSVASFRSHAASSTTRASPKSQIFTSQVPESSTFAGLRSRWRTWAAWRYWSAARIWCEIHCTCATEMFCGDAISFRRSRSTKSKTTLNERVDGSRRAARA